VQRVDLDAMSAGEFVARLPHAPDLARSGQKDENITRDLALEPLERG
jgi:hypothetical protein